MQGQVQGHLSADPSASSGAVGYAYDASAGHLNPGVDGMRANGDFGGGGGAGGTGGTAPTGSDYVNLASSAIGDVFGLIREGIKDKRAREQANQAEQFLQDATKRYGELSGYEQQQVSKLQAELNIAKSELEKPWYTKPTGVVALALGGALLIGGVAVMTARGRRAPAPAGHLAFRGNPDGAALLTAPDGQSVTDGWYSYSSAGCGSCYY